MSPLDSQSDLLARLMDAATMRHRVLSQNVANLNTPGYKRLEVSFEDQFAEALASAGRPGSSAAGVEPSIHESQDVSPRMDGNTVDLDREVSELQRTSLMFQTYTQLLQIRIGMMRRAMGSR